MTGVRAARERVKRMEAARAEVNFMMAVVWGNLVRVGVVVWNQLISRFKGMCC